MLYKTLQIIMSVSHKIHRRFWHYYTVTLLKYYNVECVNPQFNGRIYLKLSSNKNISIGKNFYCNSGPAYCINSSAYTKIIVKPNARLEIGENTGISSTVISCSNHIHIGNGVNIGFGSVIMDSNFHSTNPVLRGNREEKENDIRTCPVIIGDNVFIGAHSLILKGVEIGNNSIIAAGSVVTKSIPANEVWGGNPAKFIKKLNV